MSDLEQSEPKFICWQDDTAPLRDRGARCDSRETALIWIWICVWRDRERCRENVGVCMCVAGSQILVLFEVGTADQYTFVF